MSQKNNLFDDGSDGEEETLQINKTYAAKYEEWRRGEELEKLKNYLGEDGIPSSDSESSEGNFVEPDNPAFDRDFLLALGALHKKNEINLGEEKFFTGNYRIKKDKEEKDKEEKAMTIQDYQRHIIVDRCGELDDETDATAVRKSDYNPLQGTKITGFDDDDDDDDASDDGNGLLTSGLFKVKECPPKKTEEPLEAVDDAVAFVKGESSKISSDRDKDLLEGVRNAWNNPNLSKDDKWLADFFVNKRYLDDDDETIERAYNEVIIDEEPLSDDEKTLEKMESFESLYRFRYEEPDQEFTKRYPRVIPKSLRAKDERRKRMHKAVKQRKKEEKEMRRIAIEKLKALKYKEIEAKIEKIKEVSGNMDIDLGEKELEDDFDPNAHDVAMSHMFGDDYYEADEGNTAKPVFSDDEDIIKNYDDWMVKQGAADVAGDVDDGEEGDNENAEYYGENFNMDADYDPSKAKKELQKEMIVASGKKCRRKSKFAKALAKKKPVFNPLEKKFDAYFEEYYQLDFEDIVGDIPCRFKYRKVESNDFGLSTEEILAAQDRELNRWYSLKKLLKHNRTFKEEHLDRCRYKNRSSLPHVKQKILPSLFVEDPDELQINEQEKKKLKNQEKKLRKRQRLQENQENIVEGNNNDHLSISNEAASGKLLKIKTDSGQDEMNVAVSPQSKSIKAKNKKQSPKGGDRQSCKKKRKNPKADEPDTVENLQKADSPSFNSNKIKEENTAKEGSLKLPKMIKEDGVIGNSESTYNSSMPEKSSIIISTKKLKGNSEVNECTLLEGTKMKNVIDGVYNLLKVENTDDQPNLCGSTAINKKKRKNKGSRGQPSCIAGKVIKHGKKNKRRNGGTYSLFRCLSNARLAAYGQNPKKFKNKIKYGKRY